MSGDLTTLLNYALTDARNTYVRLDDLQAKLDDEKRRAFNMFQEKIDFEKRGIRGLVSVLNELEQYFSDYERVVQEKDEVIQEKDAVIQEKDKAIQEKDARITSLKAEITSLKAEIASLINAAESADMSIKRNEALRKQIVGDTIRNLKKDVKTAVYFLKTTQAVKIGISKNVEQRISGLKTGSSQEISTIGTVWFENVSLARKAESILHETFSKYKTAGGGTEWFSLDVLKYIEPFSESAVLSIIAEASKSGRVLMYE